MAEDFLGERFHGDHIPHTDEELEGAYGKEWLKALEDRIAARVAGKTAKSDGGKPAEGEQIELEDKFLPRKR